MTPGRGSPCSSTTIPRIFPYCSWANVKPEKIKRQIPGGDDGAVTEEVQGKLTFDSSYPTGGELLAPSDLGLDDIDHLNVMLLSGAFPVWDKTNDKLKVFTAAGAEVANTTDLSSLSGYFVARKSNN